MINNVKYGLACRAVTVAMLLSGWLSASAQEMTATDTRRGSM